MIPNIGELSVLMSKWDINQQRKNKWKNSRYKALDYYKAAKSSFTDAGPRKTRIDIIKYLLKGDIHSEES